MAAKNVRVSLNSPALRAVMQSAAMQSDLVARGERIAAAAGGSGDFEVDATTNRDRAVVFVRTATSEGRAAEAEKRALSRAIQAGR